MFSVQKCSWKHLLACLVAGQGFGVNLMHIENARLYPEKPWALQKSGCIFKMVIGNYIPHACQAKLFYISARLFLAQYRMTLHVVERIYKCCTWRCKHPYSGLSVVAVVKQNSRAAVAPQYAHVTCSRKVLLLHEVQIRLLLLLGFAVYNLY